jgi:hypothetical protein
MKRKVWILALALAGLAAAYPSRGHRSLLGTHQYQYYSGNGSNCSCSSSNCCSGNCDCATPQSTNGTCKVSQQLVTEHREARP